MSELDKLQDAFIKADTLAQTGDPQAKADAAMFAAEIKRMQSGGAAEKKTGEGFMPQLNAGIAESAGGLVDFLNPFDQPLWAGAPSTGSAAEGLKSGMGAAGINVAERPPEGIVEGFARGTGNAAGAILPVGKGVQALEAAPGVIGKIATTIAPSLRSGPGAVAELASGGNAGAAMETAEQAGAPSWVQSLAGLIGGMAAPAISSSFNMAASLGGKAAERLPISGAIIQGGKDLIRAVAPMSKTGAMEVAKRRVQDLAGGPGRADELARMINPKDPLSRTPAEQTGDQNLLGLQQAAADESPMLRERLASRDAETKARAEAEIKGLGGEVKDAKDFFKARLKDFRVAMTDRVTTAVKMGTESLEATGPRMSETGASTAAVGKIKAELDTQLQKESELWRAVPKGTKLDMKSTRTVIEDIIKDTPWAQRRDIPPDLRAIVSPEGPLGASPSGAELHGLYSEMRRISRAAMSGTNQNKNTARIANAVAEAVLADMGALNASTAIGRALNDARAFSSALHETFDRGAVGRMLQRTIDGDEAIAPEAALARTVGRGGAAAVADARGVTRAAPGAADEVTDYLRGRFVDAVFDPSGKFTPGRAAQFFRDNRELLAEYPEMTKEFRRSITSREAAEGLASRTEARLKLGDQGAIADFTSGQEAVSTILGATNPANAARSVAATARKDKTGKALAGVKDAFSDFLIGKSGTESGISGKKLTALLKDPQIKSALRMVFAAQELDRVQVIATALARAETPTAGVGGVIDSPANRLLEYVVRITAARVGGNAGGGSLGGSMQTANIAQERARSILRGMTNNAARKMLMDAQEDPELYRTLLMSPQMIAANKKAQSVLASYISGTVAAVASQPE